MAAMGGGTSGILQAGTTEEKGSNARLSAFVGAMAIADLVKSTLGPKGMDKILQSVGRGKGVTVTNDGATILRSIYVDNPAAKVLVDISRVQDEEVGDGTTSVVVLAGELLREAEKLIASKIHPMTIIAGFRAAATVAEASLTAGARDHSKESPSAFRESLLRVARTTLSSKILTNDRDHFAELAVDAVLRLQRPEDGVSPPALDAIHILKKAGGSLRDSFLDEGFILDKAIGVGQPRRVEGAKILVANTAMDTDKIKIYGARVRVDSMAKVAELEAAERAKMREKVQKIVSHGINAFVNRQLIYNFPEELFADAGVLAVEHADFDGIERLAAATGGEIASTFDGEPGSVRLGHCDVIEEIMIGDDRVVHFKGCARKDACTIVLRGSSSHVLEEAERSLHDALCVLAAAVADPRVVYGGGWPELRMAREVADAAATTPGKKALAMESFAAALRGIPTTICDNAGLDAAEVVTRLRAAHAADPEGCTLGVDVRGSASGGIVSEDGSGSESAPIASDGGATATAAAAAAAAAGSHGVGVGCMKRSGVTEAYRVKRQVLLSATEAAEMILRVDDIVKAAPRPRERE